MITVQFMKLKFYHFSFGWFFIFVFLILELKMVLKQGFFFSLLELHREVETILTCGLTQKFLLYSV